MTEHERGNMWIEVENALPEPGVPVLVFVRGVYGEKPRLLRAQFAPPKTLELDPDAEVNDEDYDEETDTFWCKPGWYETNEFEEIHWLIVGDVTHWMPLPEPPNGKISRPARATALAVRAER